jgi:hypothetical protein
MSPHDAGVVLILVGGVMLLVAVIQVSGKIRGTPRLQAWGNVLFGLGNVVYGLEFLRRTTFTEGSWIGWLGVSLLTASVALQFNWIRKMRRRKTATPAQ